MSRMVMRGAEKLPTVLGGGILGVAFIGLGAGLIGMSLTIIGQAASALAGMFVASRYA